MERTANPLKRLRAFGQSPWCDELSRALIQNGTLAKLVQKSGVIGVTTNPAIFQKALTSGESYQEQIERLVLDRSGKLTPKAIYEELAVADVRAAADVLAPIYTQTKGADGFVSLEVSPELAHDAAATIAEARRLYAAVARENLMIKVPATQAGLKAIAQLLGEGISVNVTLIFGLTRYRQVLEAWADGIACAHERGLALERIASVASFFVSRIDTLVDRLLDDKSDTARDGAGPTLATLKGKAAIANARAAYSIWREFMSTETMRRLSKLRVRPQRLLWASTSTKNPAYRDVMYVEELVGAHTVTTMPLQTINAVLDHARITGETLISGAAQAERELGALATAGIDMEAIAQELEQQGIRLFAEAFEKLLHDVEAKIARERSKPGPRHAAPARTRRPIFVGIGGDSGSGKSTLTSAFFELFGAERITSICLDDYHSLDRRQRSLVGLTALNPRANNFALMEEQIFALKGGNPINKPIYDHRDGTIKGPETVEPREVVIIQGLHPFLVPAIRHAFDLKVWLDPEPALRIEWKLQRDMAKRGYTREQVLAELEARRADVEAYIQPQRRYADLVVSFSRGDRPLSDMGHLNVRIVLRHTLPRLALDRETINSKSVRFLTDVLDEDGRESDVIEIDGSVSVEEARLIEATIWAHIEGQHGELHYVPPERLGSYEEKARQRRHSDPLALAQLILGHRILSAQESVLLRVTAKEHERDFRAHQHVL
jgi:transaldolase